jgi:hypothetical protein
VTLHAALELIPVARLIEPQAGEISRRARKFEIRGAQSLGFLIGGIFEEHRAVPREFQLDLDRRAVANVDRLPQNAHRLPAIPIAILRGIVGIGVVDVEIVLVSEREDCQPESDAVVVTYRDPRKCRLACADDVPARAIQVAM